MKITPTEAAEMLLDERADQFKIGLIDGSYEFDSKYIKTRRRIRWIGWMPYIETVMVVSDDVHEIVLS